MRLRFVLPVALLCLAMVSPTFLRAQFQQPTKEELAMTADPKAAGEAAVYLYSEETTDDAYHFHSYYERIKVLTEKGKELATVRIPYEHGVDTVTDVQGLEDRREAPDGGARIGFVNFRHAGEHLVQPAGLLAHRQQVGGQRREDSRLAHRPGDSFATFHTHSDAHQRAGNGLVVQRGGGDAQRLHQRHRVAHQGSHGAREPRRFGLQKCVAQ